MAEFEVDQNMLKKVDGSNATYDCIKSGGSGERGALGPFGLLVLTDNSLSEQTPIYFYIAKDLTGNFNTFFCNDLTRYVPAFIIAQIFMINHFSYYVTI